jgi:hypothetical protein
MTTTHGSQEGDLTMNNQLDLDYWHDRMKGDVQFIQYMTEIYKKQQQDIHIREQKNKKVSHRTSSSSFPSPIRQQQTTRHLPHLMDHPIPSPSIELNINRYYESGSDYQYQSQRQTKTSRPHEPTPPIFPPTFTSSSQQFRFPPLHLKRAVANNLPCFYIKLENDSAQNRMPSAMKVASWVRQTVQQQSSASIGEFSLFAPAGNNRYKVGVTSKNDFLMLWNCKWPEGLDKIKVEIQRPRALPDCCALVIRYVAAELSSEFVYTEIVKSITSAVSLTKINYHHPRTTNDYRFCVTDGNEYDEILSIGRIAIGHLLLPITSFIPSLKMTYCNNCWELGHTRPQCKAEPLCRRCLDPWDYNHTCQKPVLCAQCRGPHSSLSMECSVVNNYRRTLKNEVNKAVKNGLLHQIDYNREFPAIKQTDDTHAVWGGQQGLSHNTQNQQENKQVDNLGSQINAVLEITSRMETKMDNQILRLGRLDKIAAINKQGIMVLTNIMEQIINAMPENKKNKQQLHDLSKQIEEFKDDIMEKFNMITSEQKETPSSSSLQPTNKQLIKATTPSENENNQQKEQDQLLDITDGQ